MVKQIKVDKNVPVPSKKTRHVTKRKKISSYPFASMEIGDSFFVSEKVKPKKNIFAIVSYFQRKLKPWKFIRRSVEGGARVWRIA